MIVHQGGKEGMNEWADKIMKKYYKEHYYNNLKINVNTTYLEEAIEQLNVNASIFVNQITENWDKIRIDPIKDVWKCPYCQTILHNTCPEHDLYQCDECGLAWRIVDAHPMT